MQADAIIIGGGFSGVSVALGLCQTFSLSIESRSTDARVVMFEPRPMPGTGLAYDTDEPAFRLNVAADRMGMFADAPGDFAKWLEAGHHLAQDPDALTPSGAIYAQRHLFGLYVHEHVQPYLQSGLLRHVQEKVCSAGYGDGLWQVRGKDGTTVRAPVCVLAISHPPPRMPHGLCESVTGSSLLIEHPQKRAALADIGPEERVLIAGTGLSCADVISSLRQNGHHGQITIYSRRGLCSRPHSAVRVQPYGDFTSTPATTARRLLKSVRQTVERAAADGIAWQAVFDGLREQGRAIWAALSVAERQRLVRHLRRYWDVHRFRLPPQASILMDRGFSEGWLEKLAGEIVDASCENDRLFVTFRHAGTGIVEHRVHDRLIMTTGPAHDGILDSQPWLAGLRGEGLLTPDPVGLGIACSERSVAIGRDGCEIGGLYIAGPLARGTFGELMGVPEISAQTAAIAADILKH